MTLFEPQQLSHRRGWVLVLAFALATALSMLVVGSVWAAADVCDGYQQKRDLSPSDEDRSGSYDVFNSAGVKIGTITWDNVAEPEHIRWQVEEGYTLDVCVKGGDDTATGSGQSGTVYTPTEDGKTPAVSHFAWTVNGPQPSPSPSASPSPSPSASPSSSPSAGPSASPSSSPSANPSASPTASPAPTGSASPTPTASTSPSASPAATTSASPTPSGVAGPSGGPTLVPAGPNGGPPPGGGGPGGGGQFGQGGSRGEGGGQGPDVVVTLVPPTELASGDEPAGGRIPPDLPATGAADLGRSVSLALALLVLGAAILAGAAHHQRPRPWLRAD